MFTETVDFSFSNIHFFLETQNNILRFTHVNPVCHFLMWLGNGHIYPYIFGLLKSISTIKQ